MLLYRYIQNSAAYTAVMDTWRWRGLMVSSLINVNLTEIYSRCTSKHLHLTAFGCSLFSFHCSTALLSALGDLADVPVRVGSCVIPWLKTQSSKDPSHLVLS